LQRGTRRGRRNVVAAARGGVCGDHRRQATDKDQGASQAVALWISSRLPSAARAVRLACAEPDQRGAAYRKAGVGPEYTELARKILYSKQARAEWLANGGTRQADESLKGGQSAFPYTPPPENKPKVLAKMDLAEAVEFDFPMAAANIQRVRPGMETLTLSSKSGAGMDKWLEFLTSTRAQTLASIQSAGSHA
jgi:hypothetical protein